MSILFSFSHTTGEHVEFRDMPLYIDAVCISPGERGNYHWDGSAPEFEIKKIAVDVCEDEYGYGAILHENSFSPEGWDKLMADCELRYYDWGHNHGWDRDPDECDDDYKDNEDDY